MKLKESNLKLCNLIGRLGVVIDHLQEDEYNSMAEVVKEAVINLRSQESGTKAQVTNKNMVKCLCEKCSAYSHCNRDEKDKWYCNWYFKQETKA